MKALIPAAGMGTRWYPWSRVIPKELLPLGNYPAIHYVLEEAVAAGITEIGIIINEAKHLIKAYVDDVWKVHHKQVQIAWFYQTTPLGVGNALLCAKEWVSDKPTAVFYPDEIHPQKGGMKQLLMAYEKSSGCWLGMMINKQERRQAMLDIETIETRVVKVHGFCDESEFTNIGYGTGRYILNSGLNSLNGYLSPIKLTYPGELDDDKLFNPLWKYGVRGVVLDLPILEIGTPENYRSALFVMNKRPNLFEFSSYSIM